MRIGSRWLIALVLVVSAMRAPRAQQLQYLSGQSVVPFFEGWEQNDDGSFSLVFGYLNRNYREELNIALGPDNKIEPASIEQTQPTYFYPRRHRFMFRVRVPKDWGKKDVIWSVTANGKTEKVYGDLQPEMAINDQVIGENRGGGGSENARPTIALEGTNHRSAKTGESVRLTVKISDDGIPKRRSTPPQLSPSDQPGVGVDVDGTGHPIVASGRFGRRNASGLRVAWIQWRGPGHISFNPWYMEGIEDHLPEWVPPELPADGRVTTTARFSAPGTYVVRAMADDGALFSATDITIVVTGPAVEQ
jgi:hypothetical protein